MGHRNSSRTRVAPVFDQLYRLDESGTQWIDVLVSLGSRKDVVATIAKSQRLVAHHGRRWGSKEMSLRAPQALLEFLVKNLDPNAVEASGDSEESLKHRRKLASGDERTLAEALSRIRAGQRGQKWWVLEGGSKPDVLLEGRDVVLCIEGKRTEDMCTIKTKWMQGRSQLVRHMDAAKDRFPRKRVLGLLIVEGDGGADAIHPSSFWLAQSEAQYEQAMMDKSLPHRSSTERSKIASGIIGVTTWQAVCHAFGIDWSALPDTI